MSPADPAATAHDDVRERRPRMIEVVLRRPRRMIRMRMIEPEQLAAELGCAAFGFPIVRRPHQKSAARPFFGRVRQRDDVGDAPSRPISAPQHSCGYVS